MAEAAYPGTLIVQSWRDSVYLARAFYGRPAIDPQRTRLAGGIAFAIGSRQVLESIDLVRWSNGILEMWVILPAVCVTGRIVLWRGPDVSQADASATTFSVAHSDPRATYLGRDVLGNRPYLTTQTLVARARAVATGMERLRAAGNYWRGFAAR